MTLKQACQHMTADTLARMYADFPAGAEYFKAKMIVLYALRALVGQIDGDAMALGAEADKQAGNLIGNHLYR